MTSHGITRAAALVEIDGEVLLLKLSSAAWQEILTICVRDNSGKLVAAHTPNQQILVEIDNEH